MKEKLGKKKEKERFWKLGIAVILCACIIAIGLSGSFFKIEAAGGSSTDVSKCPRCGGTNFTNNYVIEKATCQKGGKTGTVCSNCKWVKIATDTPRNNNHNYELISDSATCKAAGTKVYKCKWCTLTKEEASSKKDHSWGANIHQAPTCIAAGRDYSKCTVCGAESSGTVIPPTGGHSYTEFVRTDVIATCKNKGCDVYQCSTPGCTATYKKETPLTDHEWNQKEATCSAAKKCVNCGHIAEAVKEHNNVEVVTKASTCYSKGRVDIICSVCGANTGGYDTPPSNNHTYTEFDHTDVAATCKNKGTDIYRCSTPGCTSTCAKETPAGDHNWEYTSTTLPTCTANGFELYTCSVCNQTKKDVIEKLGHAYRQVTIKQPTCGTAGMFEVKCVRCGIGSQAGGGTIPPTGKHSWILSGTTAPTCIANGANIYTCSVCNQTKKETIAKLGHAYRQITTKQPTCGTAGVVETKCVRCGIGCATGNGEMIPPTGKHVWEYTDTIAPTCTAHGYDLYTCSACKQTKKEADMPPTSHNYQWVETKQPTTKTNGEERLLCTLCDHDLGQSRGLYRITYVANGGKSVTMPLDQIKTEGSGIKISDTRPQRTGYKFLGWGTTTSGVNYYPGDPYDTDARLKLYAIWEPYQYHIDFNANGGCGGPSGMIKTYGVSLTLPTESPTKKDSVFIGWAANTNAKKATWTAGGTFSKNRDMTLHAVWAPDKFTVKYNLKGGMESGNVAFASQTYPYGTSVTVTSVVPTKKGYYFKGWDTSSAATKVVYGPGETYVQYRNVTLYAVWGPHPFFDNNPRFMPSKEIQEPYNINVDNAKGISEEEYQFIYDNRCKVKYKPQDMTDDEYVEDIIQRTLALGIAADLVGKIPFMSKAGLFLTHYLYGNGEKITYRAEDLYIADAQLYKTVESQKMFIRGEMEKYLKPGDTITFVDRDAAGSITFSHNAKGEESGLAVATNFPGFLALRSCSYGLSGTCSFDGEMYTMKCNFYLQDYYDFYSEKGSSNDQSNSGFLFVKNDELAYLYLRGRAQAFENTGIIVLDCTWSSKDPAILNNDILVN